MTRSSPGPPWIRSSSPSPPSTVSSPGPPATVSSSPASPATVSSPCSPRTLSLPSPPVEHVAGGPVGAAGPAAAAAIAGDVVVAGASSEGVGARAAEQVVVTVPAGDRVGPGAADEVPVVLAAALDGVAALAAGDGVRPGVAEQRVVAAGRRAAVVAVDVVVAAVAVQRVVGVATGDRIAVVPHVGDERDRREPDVEGGEVSGPVDGVGAVERGRPDAAGHPGAGPRRIAVGVRVLVRGAVARGRDRVVVGDVAGVVEADADLTAGHRVDLDGVCRGLRERDGAGRSRRRRVDEVARTVDRQRRRRRAVRASEQRHGRDRGCQRAGAPPCGLGHASSLDSAAAGARAPALRRGHPAVRRSYSRARAEINPAPCASWASLSQDRSRRVLPRLRHAKLKERAASGGVAEWSNALVLKTRVRSRGPRVRIPPPPLPPRSLVRSICRMPVSPGNFGACAARADLVAGRHCAPDRRRRRARGTSPSRRRRTRRSSTAAARCARPCSPRTGRRSPRRRASAPPAAAATSCRSPPGPMG